MNNPQPWWLTWPVTEVAAAILPWFSVNPPEYEGFAMRHVVQWMQGSDSRSASHRPSVQFEDPDIRAVAEAIQVLEHSRLLMRSPGDRAHVGLPGWPCTPWQPTPCVSISDSATLNRRPEDCVAIDAKMLAEQSNSRINGCYALNRGMGIEAQA